ncbi:hypothetical protein ACTOB_005400 [Actinoplanes oblitus]|uniref:Double-GTPase 2 domain-containing protein n=1 Tax=Actinoplanes oblitus TaxID=3040509 RepID=A0ABY8W8P1_9ACTN|nr:hypothetical protein [Actinoplanes oblitus]WIM93423.1 hypothetical protein ACTOB_005400 [Actinoplanes oblitus]
MSSPMGRKRPHQYYTYITTQDDPNYWWIAGWILAFPFVVVINAVWQAGTAAVAYTSGVTAGLGFGANPEPLPARRPVEGLGEPAYTQYLFGQAWRDVTHTVAVALRNQQDAIKVEFGRVAKLHFHTPQDESAAGRRNVIKGMALVAGGALGFLVADLLVVVTLLAQAALMGLLWVGGIVVIYTLRGADSALLLIRGIRITCPHCYCHVPYPGYRCSECPALHRDIRPGRFGMLHRICRCGMRLPTLLMLGSHRLQAVCPSCDQDLEESAGHAPEVVLPVFGATVAGKTQLLAAVTLAAEAVLSRSGGTVEASDEYARAWYRQVHDIRKRGTRVTKTPVTPQPGIALTLRTASATRHLKMFDAAGERFRSTNRVQELAYLRRREDRPVIVFVVDPLSIPKLWESLGEEQRRALEPMRAATSPMSVFEGTVPALHGMRAETEKARVAVVVTKADLIEEQIKAARVGANDSIRDWLAGPLEQGNLVRAIGHEFHSARYFLTDARLDQPAVSPSVETFVKWLLAERKVRL